jgi:hypothetical protein
MAALLLDGLGRPPVFLAIKAQAAHRLTFFCHKALIAPFGRVEQVLTTRRALMKATPQQRQKSPS